MGDARMGTWRCHEGDRWGRMAQAWPGLWAKAECPLLLFPMPFGLFSCEAKTGSLSKERITRLWGLKLEVPWNKTEASLGNRSPLRALSPLQPCGPAQENVVLCLELIKTSQSTPAPLEKRVTRIPTINSVSEGPSFLVGWHWRLAQSRYAEAGRVPGSVPRPTQGSACVGPMYTVAPRTSLLL